MKNRIYSCGLEAAFEVVGGKWKVLVLAPRPIKPNPSPASCSPTMSQTAEEKPPAVNRPWWVKFALYGLPNRGSALASMFLLVWVAALLVLYGFRDLRFSAGAAAIRPHFCGI